MLRQPVVFLLLLLHHAHTFKIMLSQPNSYKYTVRWCIEPEKKPTTEAEKENSRVLELERLKLASRIAAERYNTEQRRKMLVAASSSILGASAWVSRRLLGVVESEREALKNGSGGRSQSIATLRAMERQSLPLPVALRNGRPTVVDFYADWCENCMVMAPRVAALERQYGERVNFVTLNGDDPLGDNDALVSLFRVDGIPHFAFISGNGDVETALIGDVPVAVFAAELNALLESSGPLLHPLPYLGYDAFASKGTLQEQGFEGRGVSVFDGGRNVKLSMEAAEEIARSKVFNGENPADPTAPGFPL